MMAAVPALADWPQGGIPVGAAPGNDIGAAVVPDGQGGVIYIWLSSGENAIKARRIDRYGHDVWMSGQVAISPMGSTAPGGFSAVSDGQGGAIIAWQERTVSPYEVRIQRVDQDGNLVWPANGIPMWNGTTLREQSNPVLVKGPSRVFAVYHQNNPVPPNSIDLFAQCFDLNGNRQWGDYGAVVCTTAVGDNRNPATIARGDSSIMVAWEDFRSGNGDIYANALVNATAWVINGTPVCDLAGNQLKPVATLDGTGGMFIAWEDFRSGAGSDIYAQRYTSGGIMAWVPTGGVPVCTLSGDQKELDICRTAGNRALLVWTDQRLGAGNEDIYAMVLNDNGSQHWAETGGLMITNASGLQQLPRIAHSADGTKFVIAWEHPLASFNAGVYAQRINLDESFGWGTFVRQPDATHARKPMLVRGSDEHVFFAWEDDHNGDWDIYGQRAHWEGGGYIGSVVAPQLAEPANMGVVGTDQITFYWRRSPFPPGAEAYRLYAEDAGNPAINFGANSSDTFAQLTLPPGATYNWKVRAVNGSIPDSSDWSEVWQFTIDTSVPATPTLISPPNASHVDSNIVIFEWSLDTSAAMHHIQIDNDMGFSSPIVNDSMIGMPPYGYDFTFQPNGKYYWRVRAGSSAHVWSNWSQIWSVTVDTVPAGVDSTKPANNNNNVPVTSIVRVFFTEPVRTDTSLHFSCQPDPGNWQITQTGSILDFDPQSSFGYGTLYRINLTARDSAGNQTVVPEFSFTTENITDTVPPRLTVLANGVDMILGQQFVFECYAKDEHKLNLVHLTYGPAGSGTATGNVDMAPVSGSDSLWRYVIPANHITARGLQYQVWAQDSILAGGLSNVTNFPPDPTDFHVHAVSFPGGAYNTTYASDQWLMLSVPGDYTGVSLFDMLSDDLGAYDNTKWRLFDYQNTTLVEQGTGGSGVIRTGQAMWLRQRVSANIVLDFQGVHKSYGDRLRSQPAQVTLVPGWSDVGNPLAFDVRWDTTMALSDTASVAGPYQFNGTSWLLPNQLMGGTMSPYAGYSFRNTRATNAMLRVPYHQAWKGKDDGKALWPEGWQVRVTARSGEGHDDAWFGIGNGAAQGIDRWDFPEPPNGLVPAAGYFYVADEKCAVDLRPELGQGQVWYYELAAGGPVSMEFGLSTGIPPETAIWLLDPVRQSSFPISEGFAYQYSPEPGETARRFRLVAGAEEYVHAVLAGAFGLPPATLMEHGRPNPFSQTTTISYQLATGGPVRMAVYNVAGQMVRTLVDRTQQPGRYGVRWDGRDDRGQRAANGVYLVRMTAGGVTANQRLTLIR
jgi:hypothetical protein